MEEARVLGVLTAVHGRHRLAKAMLRAIPAGPPGWRVLVVVTMGSEDFVKMLPESRALGKDPAVIPVMAENSPLTRKWQTGLNFMRHVAGDSLDAVCIMGSDDFASIDYWRAGVHKIEDGAINPFGVRSCYMLNAKTGELGRFTMGDPERPVGCGRFYPRAALDSVDWTLWTIDRDKGLDAASEIRLAEKGVKLEVVELPGMMVDVKTEENIHGWEKFTTFCGVPFARFDEIISNERARGLLSWYGLFDSISAGIGSAA